MMPAQQRALVLFFSCALGALWLVPCRCASPKYGLIFAFYNNELYTQMDNQNEHFGYETIYGMLQLRNRHQVPNVFSSINGGLTCDAAGGDFSFWNPNGTNASLLWPGSDTWGRALQHFPPLELVMKQFALEESDWLHRSNELYWSGGQGFGDLGARDRYRECARTHPAHFVADTIAWGGDNAYDAGGFVDKFIKPHTHDLRKLMRHKFNIYIRGNTWSQSYKRVLQSGAVVFVPRNNPHDTFYTRIMERCVDCVLEYDVDDICVSVLKHLHGMNLTAMKQRAARTRDFVRTEFRLDKLYEGMLAELRKHLAREPFPDDAVLEGDVLTLGGGVRLNRTTCASNMAEHENWVGAMHTRPQSLGKHSWQLREWYDAQSCNLRDTRYLSYVAI
jgi:hypothetical protein